MGVAIMFGPGKGGPGKTTTTINLGTALSLEFLQTRLTQILLDHFSRYRATNGQREALNARILPLLLSVLLRDQALSEQNIASILTRNHIALELQAQLIPAIVEAQMCNEILVVEMDPQRNASQGLGSRLADGQKTTYDVLLNPWAGVDYAIMPTLFGMDLLQATTDMSALETLLAQPHEMRREYRLDDALRKATGTEQYHIKHQAIERYQVILIDPPPLLGLLTINSMVAADKIIAVLDMGSYSLGALDQLVPRLELVQQIQNPLMGGHTVELGGIVCNKYNQQSGYADQCAVAEQHVRQHYGGLVFDTIIPQSPRIFDAPTFGLPMQYNDPKNQATRNASLAYQALAREVIERFHLNEVER